MKRRIYISGKITGLSLEAAHDSFRQAQIHLEEKYDCEVVNPMEAVPYEKGKTWQEYMSDDIRLLLDCDSIYMLKGWEDSRGARMELDLATKLSKCSFFQS